MGTGYIPLKFSVCLHFYNLKKGTLLIQVRDEGGTRVE